VKFVLGKLTNIWKILFRKSLKDYVIMPADIINFKSIQIDKTGKIYDLTNMDDLITVCDILFPQDFFK